MHGRLTLQLQAYICRFLRSNNLNAVTYGGVQLLQIPWEVRGCVSVSAMIALY